MPSLERSANGDLHTAQDDLAGLEDLSGDEAGRVFQDVEVADVLSLGGVVDLVRGQHANGLVGSDGVVFLHPFVQGDLVGRDAAGDFALDLSGNVGVHALQGAVLSGAARQRSLGEDAQCDPPGRQLGEPQNAVGSGERRAVVAVDRPGKPVFSEQFRHDRANILGGLAGHQPGAQHLSRALVAHGEGFAALAVRNPPALEVDTPDIVGFVGFEHSVQAWAVGGNACLVDALLLQQLRLLQDAVDAGQRRRRLAGMAALPKYQQLLPAPVGVGQPQCDQLGGSVSVDGIRVLLRRSRFLFKARVALL